MLHEVLREYKAKIDEELKKFFEEKKRKEKELREIIEGIEEFTLRGGKRLRPIFAIHAYKLFEEEDPRILKASLGFELMQSYLLMHDDVIDQDELRRGKKTFHLIWAEKLGSLHDGESMAIIAGDLANTYGMELIVKSGFPKNRAFEALRIYQEVSEATGYGQFLDVMLERTPLEKVKKAEILRVYELKTAKYTVEGPLHFGAVLAGANEELGSLSDYAIPLGVAFQIQDDILGTFGKEEKTGKPIDSDIKEGKRTLLVYEAWRRAEEDEKRVIQDVLGKRDATPEEVERVREIMKSTGALDYCKKLAEDLAKKAKDALKGKDYREEGLSFLIEVAEFVIRRRY